MTSGKVILRTIKAAKKILIPLHVRPDGDVIGAALALAHFLKNLDKKTTVVSTDPIPEAISFLPGVKKIKIADPLALGLRQFDLLLLVDHAELARFTHAKDFNLPPQLPIVNIDHHLTNRKFGDLNYVDPNAPSTCELLYDLFKLWKVEITPDIAACLLTGVYTDTGGFIYPATTSSSLVKAADLIKRGADREMVVEHSFRSWPKTALKILTMIISNAKTRGATTYTSISYRDLQQNNKIKTDFSEIKSFAAANLLLAVRGIKTALIFTEEKPRKIRVTLRSRGNINVAQLANAMGGGGHRYSAGFDFNGPLKKAVSKTLKLLR